ncbi:hypothetical protein [[Flexibacter] sp. ATCC 35208]|uniref:hypothetical protein n=1 Tax=[Flexibacter] sp. ATCC 35208 TaxID=1936242 RepID=UPI0009C453E2|nr:hypothetical protein [[Flexibacter] sp. ATCC 35208]OMP75967.1 hypothetical protein BW716_27525 [[Flexibacter] sp. ATCC 35208]
MTLRDLIINISDIDGTLTIYMLDLFNPESDVVLIEQDQADNNLKIVNGQEYHYLLEVFLAKEIIEDFVVTQGREPSTEEALKWVYDYGIKDG